MGHIHWLFGVLLLGIAGCGARTAVREPTLDVPMAMDVAMDTDVPIDGLDTQDVQRPDCRRDPFLCDDGDRCTNDRCNLLTGTCEREAVQCQDNDPCTGDTCQPAVGCVFVPIDCGGCADGQRDAFRDRSRYVRIAGCAGGFSAPGLAREASPLCDRGAGDDGPNPSGRGCSASDLCAPGWHVCRSSQEVAARSPDGCNGASDAAPGSFFATRQTGPGCLQCATGTRPGCAPDSCRSDCAPTDGATNDVFGCGDLGSSPQGSCTPLNRSSNNLCSSLVAPWRCATDVPGADVRESEFVTKDGPGAGGVLCCQD